MGCGGYVRTSVGGVVVGGMFISVQKCSVVKCVESHFHVLVNLESMKWNSLV